eukprot:295583_1
MAQSGAKEWFYHSSRTGRQNPSGITLSQLNHLISQRELDSCSQIWHPTHVTSWTQLQSLPKHVQKLLNIDYYKAKPYKITNHRSRSDKPSKHRPNRARMSDGSTSHSRSQSHSHHSNTKHFHFPNPHRKTLKSPKYKRSITRRHRTHPQPIQTRPSPTSDSESSPSSYPTRGASSSQSTTPTVPSTSSTMIYDYNTENPSNPSKSKSKKIATIHNRPDAIPVSRRSKTASGGYILKHILSSKRREKKKKKERSSESDGDMDEYRQTRKVSMDSVATVPPPFPLEDVSDVDMDHILNVTATGGDITPTPSVYRMRKNSDSFDITSIAPVSEFARNFATQPQKESIMDEKCENDDEHTIQASAKRVTKPYTRHPKQARHITRITDKGKISIRRSTRKYKPITPNTTPDDTVTLERFVTDYNEIRRNRLCDTLRVIRKTYNERNTASFEIEKQHFHTQSTYKRNDLQWKERYVSAAMECYEEGIAQVRMKMQSSRSLQDYIASQLSHHNKRKERRLHRNRNETLKRQMHEYVLQQVMIDKTALDMMQQVSAQNRAMVMSRKNAQEAIETVSSLLESDAIAMESSAQWKEIVSKTQRLLEIPADALSSEGDTKLYFDELHDPLYALYEGISAQRTQWFCDRTNLRFECMIHRMFWKKYSQWMSLQHKLGEMRKREEENEEYTAQLTADMNDIISNNKMDKYELQINRKAATADAKQGALMEKRKTVGDLRNVIAKYKESVANMNEQIEDGRASNQEMQQKIQAAAHQRYEMMMDSDKEYLTTRKETVQSQQCKLEELWHEMNQKRYKLRSLQSEAAKQMKHVTCTAAGSAGRKQSESWKERLRSEAERIERLKETLRKKGEEMNQIETEIEEKEQMKMNHDQSLQFVHSTHDEVYEKYKDLNTKIDKLNTQRHDKLKQMFEAILVTSTHRTRAIDEGKEHEPGTTPPIHGIVMEMDGLVERMDDLCVENHAVIGKTFDDLKFVYDMKNDLDFEQTMLSLRGVMDSMRNNRVVLNETLRKEKDVLTQREKEIDQSYKKGRNSLKKERAIQKKQFRIECKKMRSAELMQRMQITDMTAADIIDNSLSSTEFETSSSFDDEDATTQKTQKSNTTQIY